MKNVLRKVLLGLFGLTVAVVTSVLILRNGWGLEPKNWNWIIWGNLFGHLFAQIVIEVAKDARK